MRGFSTRRSGLRRGAVATAVSIVLASGLVAGCGEEEADQQGGGGEAAAEEVKVGLTMIGPRNDRAFAQQHYEGAKRAEAEIPGVKLTAVLENRESPQEQADALKTLATAGNDIVIAGSATFAPVVDELAPRYPDVKFIQTSGFPPTQHENVTAIVHDQGQAGYAAGAVMGKLTDTDTIGYVGALEIPSDIGAENGMEAGAKSQNPDVRVLKDRVGNFNDTAKAKDIATAELDQGADQLMGFVDKAIPGLYQAAEESGKTDVGIVNITTNGCEGQGYENVVGTITPNYDNIVFTALQQQIEGNLKPGAIIVGVETPEYQDFVLCDKYKQMDEISSLHEEMMTGLAEGEIELPKSAQFPPPEYGFRRGF